ncbi:MAG: DUF4188 domain-containing protein [Pseudomonadota bacterium]
MIIAERMTAEIEGPFVVFLIGMRINKPLRVAAWLPVARAMRRMIRELYASPAESGFLGHTGLGGFTFVQYWQSFEHLEAYARAPEQKHWPAWTAFNRRVRETGRGAVGIWHETYMVEAGAYETLYRGMPAHGLGKCGRLVPATGARMEARGRVQAAE